MRVSNKQFSFAVAEMIGSAFCVSLVGLFGKALTAHTSVTTLIFLRCFLPLIVLLAIAVIHSAKSRLTLYVEVLSWIAMLQGIKHHLLAAWKTHALRAAFVVLSQYCLFIYLAHGTVLLGTLLYVTSGLFAPIITRAVLKQPVSAKTWMSIIISFVGILFIIRPTGQAMDWYLVVGLASGFFNACSQITLHHGAKRHGAFNVTLNMYLYSTLIAMVPFLLFMHTQDMSFLFGVHAGVGVWVLLAAFSLASVANQSLRAMAYRYVNKAASLGVFLYLSIVFSGVFDWLIYRKVPDDFTLAGAALVILGGFVMAIRRTNVQKINSRPRLLYQIIKIKRGIK